MASKKPPSSPQLFGSLVDREGRLTTEGLLFMEGIWRQIVAGYVIVPCNVASASNVLTLTPTLNKEGAATYGDHMTFSGVADATSTGSVTARVGELPTLKVYKDGGSTQAGSGDIVSGRLYLFIYNSALDSGNGGLVLK